MRAIGTASQQDVSLSNISHTHTLSHMLELYVSIDR